MVCVMGSEFVLARNVCTHTTNHWYQARNYLTMLFPLTPLLGSLRLLTFQISVHTAMQFFF